MGSLWGIDPIIHCTLNRSSTTELCSALCNSDDDGCTLLVITKINLLVV